MDSANDHTVAVERPESGVLVTTGRSTLRRKAERGSTEKELVNSILDEGLVAHVGFSDQGSTFVLPMVYARVEDTLYLHGALSNRMLWRIAEGGEICVTVTLLDGLVLARSAFHHSVNFRSVVLLGVTRVVMDEDEKYRAMVALLEHMIPGRSREARLPSLKELRATRMVSLPITEGSAKVRTGGPIDEEQDLELAVWAGEIPLGIVAREGVADEGRPKELDVPSYVRSYPARGIRGKP